MKQVLLIMRLTIILLTIGILQVSAATYAQKITLNEKNAKLTDVIKQIRLQSGYQFVYRDDLLENSSTVTIHLKDATLDEALKQALQNAPFTFEIQDGTVVIQPKEETFIDKIKQAFANIDVHGRVLSDDGQPLSGATVTIKGTSYSTATDANGYFSLTNVDPNATIAITYIGYDKTELKANKELGAIKMVVTQSKLDEVKVIAYGQTTDRLSTGNIASVSAKEIEEQPVGNVLEALEGRVPGLYINQVKGISGSAMSVQIQGQNSITKGNDPFYVVDGVPYASQLLPNLGNNMLGTGKGNLSASASTASVLQAGSPFSFINPDDIESISILKDADATAIYGSRAANGAILITTRKGRAGETKIDFNVQQGWGQVDRTMQLMNTQEYLQMRYAAMRNDGIAIPSSTDYDINGLWDQSRYTDWQKVLLGGTSQYSDYNATVSGGTANTQYLIGGTLHRETLIYPGTSADQKGAIHFNINSASANQKFHITFSGNYLADNNQLPNSDLTQAALTTPPDAPSLYKADGTLNWQQDGNGNSSWTNLLAFTTTRYLNQTSNLVASTLLKYQVIPGLDISSSFGYNRLQSNETSFIPESYYAPEVAAIFNGRSAQYAYNTMSSWIIEPQLHYNKTFGKGKLDALLGSTIQQNNSNSLQLNGSGYSTDAVLEDIHSATSVTVGSSLQSIYKYNALFGRLNYNWNDKYIVNLTARRDGSSRFGADNEFHDFWAAGGAWLFSNEDFIKMNLPVLSTGKLKVSYGTTGNDQIGDYQFLSTYNPVSQQVPYQGVPIIAPTGLSNPALQWETTQKFNIGLDAGILRDRVTFSINYFINRTSNELVSTPLPQITGFATIIQNLPATVQNTGLELTISSTNIQTKDFSWSSGFNLTAPRNKLISFQGLTTSSYAGTFVIGQPISLFKAFHYLGADPATGIYLFEDKNGNPTSTPNGISTPGVTDRTVILNPNPVVYGGLSNHFHYKSFDLDVLFQFTQKKGPNYYFGQSVPGLMINEPVNILKAWQKPGDITSIGRYSYTGSLFSQFSSATNSDAYYSDASFVRLKNASLSWQIPRTWQQKAGLQSARLYVQGQNLLTFTKYPGFDPETGMGLPPLRVITLGVQVGL